MADNINIVWFKRDLRIYDHAPLWQASKSGFVIPLYIIEPDYWDLPDTSYRQWSFIYDCLKDLDRELEKIGTPLIIRRGKALEVMESFRGMWRNFTLWSHEETGNEWTFKRDLEVSAWCKAHDISWNEFPNNGVVRRLKSRDTWSKIRNERMAKSIITLPDFIQKPPTLIKSDFLQRDILSRGDDYIASPQEGGRTEGIQILKSFIDYRSVNYLKTISKPGVSARHCSRLSAHIAYGTVSVREIEQKIKLASQNLKLEKTIETKNKARNLDAFLSRLAWRCHFVQKLEQQPNIETQCMHPAFEGMREPFFREDYFEAWKYGKTGYPLIDACMRSLIANGWITFRMRAMLVSFASHHLWLDWRKTAPYLARLFTDYEPGIHYSQMQMQSGVTGINAVRIYNPIKQSIEHDPEGRFIRRYVPELAFISDQWIHEPWKMNLPPNNYSAPIIQHEIAIKTARSFLSQRWKSEDFHAQAGAINQKLGSRKRSSSAPRSKSKKNLPQLTFNFDNSEPKR